MSTVTQSVTALAQWANSKESWIRSIAQRVISERRELSDVEIKDLYNKLLTETGLNDGEPEKSPKIKIRHTEPSSGPSLRLKSLAEVSGVNRLTERQTIEFNERLTIIYGENATGKSGYSRILKSAANSRGSAPVLGNVYDVSTTSQSARITFDLSSEIQDVKWNGHPIEGLEGVSVFDAPTAPMHVDENLEYQYVPADLGLFEYVHSAIKSVQALLDEEKERRRPQSDICQGRFNEGTKVFLALNNLNNSADMKQIRDWVKQSQEETINITELRNRVAVLSGDQNGNKSLGIKTIRDKCNKALESCAVLLGFDGSKYSDLTASIEVAREEVMTMSAALFEGLDRDLYPMVALSWNLLFSQFFSAVLRLLASPTCSGSECRSWRSAPQIRRPPSSPHAASLFCLTWLSPSASRRRGRAFAASCRASRTSCSAIR